MNCLSHLVVVLIYGLHLLLTVSCADNNLYDVRPEYDICNPETLVNNPNSVYLPTLESSTEVYVNRPYTGRSADNINCLLFIKTCPNCHIAVENTLSSFRYPPCMMNVPSDEDVGYVCIPNCAYLYLFDADYRSQTSKAIVSSPVSYKSESRQLHIIACGMNYNQNISMRLRLTVKEKLKVITYSSTVLFPQSVFNFASPYFPSPYAKNSEMYTFKLQSLEPYMIVVVSFDDWMLTANSYLEVYGATDVVKVTGSKDRPLIQSVGPNLTVNFFTGEPVSGQSSFLGFKATAAFVPNYVSVIKPSTACDQDISSEGGIIRLTIADGQMKDCIFVIRKVSRFDGVYLRVLKSQSEGQHDTLEYSFDIYNGITSMGELKAHVQRNDPYLNSSVLLSDDGFYIRYTGRYYDGSSHFLAYSMFLDDCDVVGGYFRCKNERCISMTLKCDGYDHCGDGSDEYTSLCTYETTHSSGTYPISIGIIIPLVVSVFLIIVVCVLILFIRRCRRLNNATRARRQPAVRSNRQRMRQNRDVQMSVTVRSGEHPPSYDEVLQNTPIGYLNMAFTWSQHGNLAQPPSYEEAVSPTAQQNGSIIITATANNGISHEEASRHSRQNSSTVLTTTISASLDPRAEVSSSSSSDDVPDQFRQFDSSSSSESSIENEHRLTPNGHNVDIFRSNLNLNKGNKDLGHDAGSQRSSPKYGHSGDGIQVILGTPGSAKVNSEGQERIKPVTNQKTEGSDSSRHENNAGREHLNIRDRQQSFGELRNVSDGREGQGLLPSERFDGQSGANQNHSVSGSQVFGNAERESKQGRDRVDMYQKNKGKLSQRNVDREGEVGHRPGMHSDGLNIHLPKVTDTARSQSCFDLSLGAGAARLLDGSSARSREEDKRFSYAGAGDTSLARDGLNPFYSGRGLIRERPNEHLDQYAAQSYENVRDDNTVRKQDKLGYGAGNEQDEVQQHRHNRASNSPGYFPKSTRDKNDSQRARGQYSNLAPVTENLYDETHHVSASIPESTHRHMHSGHTDDQLQKTASNNWPQQRRMPLEYGREYNQVHSSSSQKTSPQSRGPSHEHLLPGSTRSLPSDRMAAVLGDNSVNRHDHRKPSSDESSRQQTELPNSRNNFGYLQNQNVNSSKNIIAHSAMQDGAKNSRGNSSAEHNKAPQSDQDTSASVFKPKPSLRRSRMKTAQRPDGHSAESVANSSSQGHNQASHRPVPAPRQGIRKQEPVHGSAPLPDTHSSWSLQGANRSRNGHNQRRDESSLHTADQTHSTDHIDVQATSDDVFV